MRPSLRSLMAAVATPPSAVAGPLKSAAMMALMPPIPLYRRLLRAHRKHLDGEKRMLGDLYVKAEFRAHRNVDNPAHLIGFLTEWQLYAQQVEGNTWAGEKIDRGKFEKLSDEQIGQLYELMTAIRKRDQGEEEP